MNNNLKKKFGLIILFLFITGFFTNFIWTQPSELLSNDNVNNRRILKISQNEISFIHISSDNWTGYNGQPWFHLGDGTKNNPHKIENVTINANYKDSAVYIYDSDQPFIIQNCTILNGKLSSDHGGIICSYSSNGTIINNTIKNSYEGIFLNEITEFKVFNNSIFNCSDNGILARDSTYSDISSNTVYNCINNGIRIDYSNNLEIRDNNVFGNEWRGINIVYNCSNIKIRGNTILNHNSGSAIGIMLSGTMDYPNLDNEIYNNTVKNSTNYGIYLGSYTNSTSIIHNNISENWVGLRIHSTCFDNSVYLNNFSNNTYNAWDSTSFNSWDNESIGNLWDDYISAQGGYDLDDNGIGDIPYKIYDGPSQTINTVNDSLPICDDGDDTPPTISIVNPVNDTIYSSPPTITVSISDNGEIDSQWYKVLNTSEIDTCSGTEFQINTEIWNNQSEGLILIRVFVNDTGGNSDSTVLQVIKDTIVPSIDITSPSDGTLFSETPEIQVSIFDIHINETWYTILGSGENYIFETSSFTVHSSLWMNQAQGNFTVRVFANDSAGNLRYADLILNKDTINPFLMINSPLSGTEFGNTSPTINLTITEANLFQFWFTINDSSTLHFVAASSGENTFSIESSIWDLIPEGHVLITFFANDTLGQTGTISITIIKEIPEEPSEPPSIPGFNVLILLFFSLFSVIVLSRMQIKKN